MDYIASLHQRISRAAAVTGFRGERFGAVGDDDLWIWSRLGSKPDAPVVFLSSGVHGDERSGPEAVVGLMEEGSWDERFNWVVLPMLNPSGLRRESRENAAGIDLNRDFLRRMAGETIALIDWWRGRPKACSLHFSFHEDWEAEGFYLYEISTGAGPSLAPSILNAVGGEFPLQSDGPVDDHALAAPGWIIHAPEPDEPEGWPEAIWLSRTWPMRSYTFEAPGRQCLDRRIACLKAAGKAALGLIPGAF